MHNELEDREAKATDGEHQDLVGGENEVNGEHVKPAHEKPADGKVADGEVTDGEVADAKPSKTHEVEAVAPAAETDAMPPAVADAPKEKKANLFGPRTKKKSKAKQAGVTIEEEVIIDGTGQIFRKGAVYAYEELLQQIHALTIQHNPELQGSKRYTIKPPQVARIGSKKVAWLNFQEICVIMNRDADHAFQFVVAELGTDGSIAGDGQLILKGKFGPKHIESLLRKYITEYVTCSHCRSAKTVLERDSRTRLYHIRCDACGASRSVTTIRSGFHAVSRADRRRAKLAK